MGVRFGLEAMDGSLTAEKFYRLWFPEKRPENLKAALDAVGLFYNMGRAPSGENGPAAYDLKTDAGPIFAAFRRCYGLDLSRDRLHWWHFLALLEGLVTHSFTERVTFRTADLGGLDAAERAELLRMRRRYAIGDRGEDLRTHLQRLREISREQTERT